MFHPDTLSDNTILITGGGSGLGLAMAKKFASLGANVAICGRTEEKLKKAAEEIRQAAGNGSGQKGGGTGNTGESDRSGQPPQSGRAGQDGDSDNSGQSGTSTQSGGAGGYGKSSASGMSGLSDQYGRDAGGPQSESPAGSRGDWNVRQKGTGSPADEESDHPDDLKSGQDQSKGNDHRHSSPDRSEEGRVEPSGSEKGSDSDQAGKEKSSWWRFGSKKNEEEKESGEPAKTSEVRYYVADVRDAERVKEMIGLIVDDFGSMEGLVNNAAGNFLCASEDLTTGGFKAVVDIVLHGTFNCTHSFGNYLIDRKKTGNVLNIVATYAEGTGSAFVLPSACSKAGVLAMTRSLAYEWASYGIRLNAIAPGPFPTEGAWSRLIPSKKYEKKFLEKIPMGRYGEHEELANLAAFLMSDMAGYITGDCITIDGGEKLAAGQFNFIDSLMSREKLKKMFKMMR